MLIVGYASHVVHYGAFGARNNNVRFFMLVWDRYEFHKKRVETHYSKLVFCIWYDLWVT
jgi:hypothetical protein